VIRAVLGGSFDPVHDGHVAMARRVLAEGRTDHLVVMPAGRSPHKAQPLASAPERLAMVHLAFTGIADVSVDERELDRSGPSYTVDTMRELAAEMPEVTWRLVLGGDNLESFGAWKRPREIVDLAELVVLARPGCDLMLPPEVPADRCHVIPDFHAPVSSREIRAILARGRLPASGLPPVVAAHIRARGLYGL